MERVAILGASRGLGASLVEVLKLEGADLRLYSRGTSGHDFTDEESWIPIWKDLEQFDPERIFYTAGGGPYGAFGAKSWKDHKWAFRLNFEFPAWLLHGILSERPKSLVQLVFVGSSVAESQPDPGAASYAAAKHALRGLIDSVIAEKPSVDLRLFSPGYMDTSMLPANAWPRQQKLMTQPLDVARRLWNWSQSEVSCATFQEAPHVGKEN